MSLEENINTATINGAFSMGFQKPTEALALQKNNLNITQAYYFLLSTSLSFGSNLIDTVIIEEKVIT